MLVRERARVLLLLVEVVGDHDRLQEHRPARLGQGRAALEEGREELPPDGLDHLDRGQLVVGAGEVAVVGGQDLDPVVEALGAHPLGRVGVLMARDRRRRHPAAAGRRGMDRESAPARADLEQMVVAAEVERGAGALELRQLGVLERRPLVLEHGARVDQPRVEEGLEQGLAEVVMRGDVAVGAVARVARDQPGEALHGPQQRLHAGAQAIERRQAAADDPAEGEQVVGVPEPVDVALPEPGAARAAPSDRRAGR